MKEFKAPHYKPKKKHRSIHAHDPFKINGRKLSILNEWLSLYYATVGGEGWLTPGHDKVHINADAYNNYSIVHMIRHAEGDVYKFGFERLLREWDLVSCSLIRLGSPGDSTIADVGFALRIPPQNIVGAHAADIWIDNHAGADFMSYPKGAQRTQMSALLSENLLNDMTIHGHVSNLKRGVSSLTDVKAPLDLTTSHRNAHNEILAIGRPGVCAYNFTGLPKNLSDLVMESPTAPINVRFILINPHPEALTKWMNRSGGIPELYARYWEQARRLRGVNRNLKIKVLKHKAPGWNWSRVPGVIAGDDFIY